jgi:hypothetical protein
MARKTTAVPAAPSRVLPKLLSSAALLFIVAMVVMYPSDSADFARWLAHFIGSAIGGTVSFGRQVLHGGN